MYMRVFFSFGFCLNMLSLPMSKQFSLFVFLLHQSFPQQNSSLSGRAPKAKAKAKARGRKESGVTEERPTNEDDLRALLSLLAKQVYVFFFF